MRRSILLLMAVMAVALATGRPAAGQVKLSRGPEGRLVLTNDPVTRPVPRSVAPRPVSPREGLSIDRAQIDRLVDRYATDHGLDPMLVRALIQVESAYDPQAVSHKGALGLMQLMPQTAAELAVSNPFDAEANVRGGTAYLRQMLDTFDHELPLALAGYNAGPTAVARYGGVPPYRETREYVRRVLELYTGEAPDDLPMSAVAEARPTFLVRRDGRLVMTTTPPPDRR